MLIIDPRHLGAPTRRGAFHNLRIRQKRKDILRRRHDILFVGQFHILSRLCLATNATFFVAAHPPVNAP
jgi:hypothetical protein